jgi:hypothetical protein
MSPLESALIGFSLIGAGVAAFVWGVRCRWRWERGEDVSPHVAPSFSYPPTAPGGWWISFGFALAFVGTLMLMPFIVSL